MIQTNCFSHNMTMNAPRFNNHSPEFGGSINQSYGNNALSPNSHPSTNSNIEKLNAVQRQTMNGQSINMQRSPVQQRSQPHNLLNSPNQQFRRVSPDHQIHGGIPINRNNNQLQN